MDNPNNILVSKTDIEDILNRFGNIGGPVSDTRTDTQCPRLLINNLFYYQKAFTHESYYQSVRNMINNQDVSKCYLTFIPDESSERLEFLGDNVLKMIMGWYFFTRYPDDREKFMTNLKIKIEQSSMLNKIGLELGFKKYLLLSLSVENNTMLGCDLGRNSSCYIEDAFESFIGAIVVDFGEMGIIYANRFFINVMENLIDFAELNSIDDNYKDIIVKTFVSLKWPKPNFTSLESSDTPLNLKIFPTILVIEREFLSIKQIECLLDYTRKLILKHPELNINLGDNSLVAGFGTGRRNKQAQQECSRQAIINLEF